METKNDSDRISMHLTGGYRSLNKLMLMPSLNNMY